MTNECYNNAVESVPKTIAKRPPRWRPRCGGAGSTRDAKRLAAVVLEVFAGLRTPQQGAEALAMSLGGYYQLEARAMQGLLEACEPKPRGRQPDPEREMTVIRRENERLRRDLGRQSRRAGIGARHAADDRPEPAATSAQGDHEVIRQEDTEAQTGRPRPGAGDALAAGSDNDRSGE